MVADMEIGDAFESNWGVRAIIYNIEKTEITYVLCFDLNPVKDTEFKSRIKCFKERYPNKIKYLSSPLWKALHNV